jgi:hypothetical protein
MGRYASEKAGTGGTIVKFGVGREIGTKGEIFFDDNFLPTLRSSGVRYEAA